jgi:glycosyltransferase involved in cell wall biosynthesis
LTFGGEGELTPANCFYMRVLQVLEATLGGTRRYLDDIARVLGAGENYGLVYSLHRADSGFYLLLEKLRAANWHLYELDMQRVIDVRRDYRNTCELKRIYEAFKPDVVHAHASKAGALARLASIGSSTRPGIVYSPHSINATRSRLAFATEKVLASRLDVLAAVTPSERDELIRLRLVPPSSVKIIAPTILDAPVGHEEHVAARLRLGIPTDPIVVSVGRLVAQKDPLGFVELISRLRRSHQNLKAFWIGDGELRAATERSIKRHGLDASLVITGWLDDTRSHLAACDIFVSLAAFESFGYATAEAMAMERPVVASAVVGTIDVVLTDAELQLFPVRDVEQAVRNITYLLNYPTIATAIAKRARKSITLAYREENSRRALMEAYATAQGH